MTRYAIGDIQGCYDELRELLARLRFSSDRDRLWLVGDLVNRGPDSLEVLRFVKALGDNAVVVLGNHDLHLLALAYGSDERRKPDDTLDAVLAAPDRDALLDWLRLRPLFFRERAGIASMPDDCLVHGGLIPQWTIDEALALAGEVEHALRSAPRELFDHMYGGQPDRWSPDLAGADRLRFLINAFTRMRFCAADGRIDLKLKGGPGEAPPPWRPWFEHEDRRSASARVIFGHWSTLGYVNTGRIVALDTGCVWGSALTALDLDSASPPVNVPCRGARRS